MYLILGILEDLKQYGETLEILDQLRDLIAEGRLDVHGEEWAAIFQDFKRLDRWWSSQK